jgi:hypothetical protein
MPRYRLPYLLIPIAAFIIVFPLIGHGCSCGHDFDFHLTNWFEAAKQFTHGTLRPHWAYTPAWNAGEPRFVFYPPLSWTIGAILGFLMPWTWTPIAYTWLALTIAGIACFHAARTFAPPNAALLAATIYIANPYTLYTAIERTAYAELLAAAWIPLLLRGILRDRVTIPGIAIPITLLWLTNAPAAVMGCYALALLTIVRLTLSHSEPRARIALNTLAGTAIGLGLAAFYIVPAAYERRFVQIRYAILPGLVPWDNFLLHRTHDADHDGVLRTASIVAVLLIVATTAALFFARSNHRPSTSSATNHTYLPDTTLARLRLRLSILALAIALMLTPLSTLLWMHLPELRFLQFPWRITAILAAVFALALSLALSRLSLKPTTTTVFSLLAVFLLAFPAWHAFRQYCYPEDTAETRLAVFHSANPGSEPTDEYAPIGADNQALKTANPGYWLASTANAPPPQPSTPAPAPPQFDLAPPSPTTLILNLRDYPAWHITSNGSPIATRLHRPDGLIAIPLPAGPAHIEITYTELLDQRIGYLLTALSAGALAVVLKPRRKLLPLRR